MNDYDQENYQRQEQEQDRNPTPNQGDDPNEIRNKLLFFVAAIIFLVIFKYAFGF